MTLRRGAATRTIRSSLVIFLLVCVAVLSAAATPSRAASAVRVLTFSYHSSVGPVRTAYLVLPSWYGALRHPPIPLVISPHGRGVSGSYNLRFCGDLPAHVVYALFEGFFPPGARNTLMSTGRAHCVLDLQDEFPHERITATAVQKDVLRKP